MNSVRNLLIALTLTFASGCVPTLSGPDVVTDAPSAVDAPRDSVDVAEVRSCDLLREVNRIMAEQSNVVDCGYLSVAQPAADATPFIACVNDNVAAGRPVRALYSWSGTDTTSDIAWLNLRIGGQNHCVWLETERIGAPYRRISLGHSDGQLTLNPPSSNIDPRRAAVFFQCRGNRLDEGLRYDPPRTLPNNSTICP